MSFLIALSAAGIALAAVMSVAWLVQRRTGNSGWIDAIWTFGTGLVAAGLALSPLSEESAPWRQQVVAAMALIWSVRLGWHIVGRTRQAHDDPRYRAMMEKWGKEGPRRLFQFLQAQAAVALVLAAAIMLAAYNARADFGLLDALAIAVFALGWIIEALSDAQLRQFKRTAEPSAVCNVGLWAWSRHPNYFGEWLCWCAYPLLAINLAHPAGWLSLIGPAIIYWTLVYASGIPPLEAHMRRSRPQAWAAYAARTSPFFPWPPSR